MIISVSRRTDIPAFYSEWFMKRLQDGHLMVRNPMNYHQISKISLSPELVDCLVFWTKNPLPMLKHLDNLAQKYEFYFQYTLNGYERDIEENVPDMAQRVLTLQRLSEKIGAKRVIWRYDPILLTDKYSVAWHLEAFSMLAEKMSSYVELCVFSFLDMYPKIGRNTSAAGIRPCCDEDMKKIAAGFAAIASKYDLKLRTCAEKVDFSAYGIEHNCCIDSELIGRLTGYEILAGKDKNQRQECGCVESIDVGQYNTCSHGCKYCYANFNAKSVATFRAQHNPESPLLIGELSSTDKITERKMKSLWGKVLNQEQLSLF